MKRCHQELERTKRIYQLHLRGMRGSQVSPVNCICEFQTGRFRKRKAFGCGKSRCLLCHYEKIFSIASVKDKIQEQQYLDSLSDYFDNQNKS